MTTTKNHAVIFERQTGTRTIAGTDWPVKDQIVRQGRKYTVVWGLCNGVPADSDTYPTLREALSKLGIEGASMNERYVVGLRPRAYLTQDGTQYTSGYDERYPHAYGRTPRAAARRYVNTYRGLEAGQMFDRWAEEWVEGHLEWLGTLGHYAPCWVDAGGTASPLT